MPLTPLQRKAAFAHAVTMRETNRSAAALSMGRSATHVDLVLAGVRTGSDELKQKLADYCGHTVEAFWGPAIAHVPTARAS